MEELEPLKESRKTLIIEKETEPVSEFLLSKKTEEKKESAKKVLFENNSSEKFIEQLKKNISAQTSTQTNISTPSPKFEFEASKSFFTEEPKIQKEIEEEILIESEPLIEVSEQKQVETQNISETEVQDISEIEENPVEETNTKKYKKAAKKVNFKSRLRIMVFGACAVLVCFMGWSIYNAVEIETLRAQMDSANKTYSVNIASYINNLSKADDLTSDSIFNLDELSNAGVVPLTPSLLEKPTPYSINSNWFNRFCNWLSGIFK